MENINNRYAQNGQGNEQCSNDHCNDQCNCGMDACRCRHKFHHCLFVGLQLLSMAVTVMTFKEVGRLRRKVRKLCHA